MEKIINTAQYMANRYKEIAGEPIDEMKLHKLLYFAQRESLAITGEPLFNEKFEGWRYGPVCREIRAEYDFFDGTVSGEEVQISDRAAYIINNVILEYGTLASWKLSELSHKETSWINSRIGLTSEDRGNKLLKLEDIREDAKKIRPYDHLWDMYYDEFDDCEGENDR